MSDHSATIKVPARADAFEAALEGLTRVNVGLMQREKLPPLYEAGVRYKDEPRDVWRHALDVAREKWGDCEDLAAYRAAELRVSGEDPEAHIVVYQSAPNRYHCIVGRSGGVTEDPSRVLGMGQKPMGKNQSANVLGADPTPADAMTFEIITIPGGYGRRAGYRGYVRLPLGMVPGAASPQAMFTVGPQATTPEAATKAALAAAAAPLKAAAASAATQLLQNPAINAALSTVPGGAAAAAVLANPQVQNAVKAAANVAKKLKFW